MSWRVVTGKYGFIGTTLAHVRALTGGRCADVLPSLDILEVVTFLHSVAAAAPGGEAGLIPSWRSNRPARQR